MSPELATRKIAGMVSLGLLLGLLFFGDAAAFHTFQGDSIASRQLASDSSKHTGTFVGILLGTLAPCLFCCCCIQCLCRRKYKLDRTEAKRKQYSPPALVVSSTRGSIPAVHPIQLATHSTDNSSASIATVDVVVVCSNTSEDEGSSGEQHLQPVDATCVAQL